MEPIFQEWANLVVRWIHVLAAIMWVGDSFLFMWLDSHLETPRKPREGAVVGELWMTHSGGFYEVVKRKYLAPDELPPNLYWFKWESYTTWISGFLLLSIVYYLNGGVLLVDANVSAITPAAAVGISLGLLVGGWLVYDTLCRVIGDRPLVLAGAGFALILGAAFGVTQLFGARAAYLQVGAMIGTCMAANVFFRIIPGQKHMLAATRAGTPVDLSYGARAKIRSRHNHYLTIPVLFTMLSNHFPSTYGHRYPYVVLGLLFIVGAGLKFVMNFKLSKGPLVPTAVVVSLVAVLALTFPRAEGPDVGGLPPVAFATVQTIVQTRCVTCHATTPANPAFTAPPLGLKLETAQEIKANAAKILLRAVQTKTMPLANLTGMLETERVTLGAWIVQGASIDGAVDAPIAPAAPSPVYANAQEEAKAVFAGRCVACHGAAGKGDGIAAAALTPKPRDYSDAVWQASVTDDDLRKVIVAGGAAIGKSPLMPPNPDLAQKPEVVSEIVLIVRAFGQR